MAILLSPLAKQQFCDGNGDPLVGGKLYTYFAGTLNPVVTYADKTGTENANPIILDGDGRASIWLADTGDYKFVLTDADDVAIYTVDEITYPTTGGGGGGGGGGALRAGTSTIANGGITHTVAFSTPVSDTTYRINAVFTNIVDTDPIFLMGTVTAKTTGGFTMTLNTQTDSGNYKIEYTINTDV